MANPEHEHSEWVKNPFVRQHKINKMLNVR